MFKNYWRDSMLSIMKIVSFVRAILRPSIYAKSRLMPAVFPTWKHTVGAPSYFPLKA